MGGNLDMEKRVEDHERRIGTLEVNYKSLESKISSMETGIHRVESTVLRESKSQSDLLNKLIEHHFGQVQTKTLAKKEIWIAVLGTGGIYTFVQFMISFFSKGGA